MRCLSFYVVIVIFCSCEKNPCGKDYSYYKDSPISPELEAFKFKEGSYWVYMNPSNGDLDSHYVYNTYEHTYSTYANSSSCETSSRSEYFYSNMHREYRTSSDTLNSILNFQLVGNSLRIIHGEITSYPNSFPDFPIRGLWIYSPDSTSNYQPMFQYDHYYQSLIVNGNQYSNVWRYKGEEMQGAWIGQVSNGDLYFYVDEVIGIVKIEVDLGNGNFETWVLHNYNLVY